MKKAFKWALYALGALFSYILIEIIFSLIMSFGGAAISAIAASFKKRALISCMVIVTLIMVILTIISIRKYLAIDKSYEIGPGYFLGLDLYPVKEYTRLDPGFDANDLEDRITNIFVRFRNCMSAGNIKEFRPFFTDEVFDKYQEHLDQNSAKGITECFGDISVNDISLLGYYTEDGYDHMIARIEAANREYTVRGKNRRPQSGAKGKLKKLRYEYDLIRPEGKTTMFKDDALPETCPTCGGPVDMTRGSRCEYCGCPLGSTVNDWIVAGITKVAIRAEE